LALDLARLHRDASAGQEVFLGFLEARRVNGLHADDLGQSRGKGAFQPQRRVGGMATALLRGIIIVIALNGNDAENTLNFQAFPALAMPAGRGFERGVDALGGLLKQITDNGAGALENRRPQEDFQLLDSQSVGVGLQKAGHQPRDFLLLGEGEAGREFFFEPARRSARVCSMTI